MVIVSTYRAALAVLIFLVTAPAALAEPPGNPFTAPQQAAPHAEQAAPENAVPWCNPPAAGRGFLSSAPNSYWRKFHQSLDHPWDTTGAGGC